MTDTKVAAKTEPKSKQKSYFTRDVLNRFVLSDGESFIEHKPLDEGLFQQYQDITSKIKVIGDSTEVDVALGKQRAFLLENLVEGWNLVDEDGASIRYTPAKLRELDPRLINDLVDDIYSKNNILSGADEDEGKDKN